MKRLTYLVLFMVVILTLANCTQQPKPVESDGSLESIALKIINNSGTCTLISLDSAGHPRARVMDPFPPNENFEIWFGTNSLSRKVIEIQDNKQVAVHYYDKPAASYVSIYGTATIINDNVSREKYWKPEWTNFYPNYPANYSLIRVIPKSLEIVSEADGIAGDSITWKPASIDF